MDGQYGVVMEQYIPVGETFNPISENTATETDSKDKEEEKEK